MEQRLGDEWIWSVEAFRVRISVALEKEWELGGSGVVYSLKCPEFVARLDLSSYSWKTRPTLLQEDSTLYSVKLPRWGTMRNGFVYRRQRLVLGIKETDGGVSVEDKMVPTPCTTGLDGGSHVRKRAREALLPTPRARDCLAEGLMAGLRRSSPSLPTVARLYPTISTHGVGGSGHYKKVQEMAREGVFNKEEARSLVAGNGGTLNPEWVEWLMGWPIGWTALSPLETVKYPSVQRLPG